MIDIKSRGAYIAPRYFYNHWRLYMNSYYLEQAMERVPNKAVLINLISQRVRQLNAGDRSLVKPDGPYMEKIDMALKEVAEGKLSVEIGSSDSGNVEMGNGVEKSNDRVISFDL